MVSDLPVMFGIMAVGFGLIFFVLGRERARIGWQMGKGLAAPIIVISVVLGSIYGGRCPYLC